MPFATIEPVVFKASPGQQQQQVNQGDEAQAMREQMREMLQEMDKLRRELSEAKEQITKTKSSDEDSEGQNEPPRKRGVNFEDRRKKESIGRTASPSTSPEREGDPWHREDRDGDPWQKGTPATRKKRGIGEDAPSGSHGARSPSPPAPQHSRKRSPTNPGKYVREPGEDKKKEKEEEEKRQKEQDKEKDKDKEGDR